MNELTIDRRERLALIGASAALALLTIFICMQRYADYDLWWHLKLGRHLFEHGSLPATDTFSYLAQGRHQFTGEWLGDAIIYLVFRGGGYLGLNLFKAAILLSTFGLIVLRIRDVSPDHRVHGTTAVLTLLLVLFAGRFHLFVRPYLFTLPMLAGVLYLLGRERAQVGRAIYLIPLLTLLWTNLSVGAVFGVFVVGVKLAAEFVGSRSLRLAPVLALTLLASLANPETYHLYLLALELTSDPYRELVGEYQSITRDLLFGSGLRYTVWFQVLLAGSLLGLLLRRGWKDPFQCLLFAFFLYEAFRQIRLVGVFSLVAAPHFYTLLRAAAARLPRLPRLGRVGVQALIAVLILALIPIAVLNSRVYTFGVGLKASAFPDGALRFLDQHGIRGRMFNSYGFGGFIIWTGGGRQVFIDGRYRRVYSVDEYGEYTRIMDSAEAWKAAERKYGFDYAVLEYDLQSQRFPAHLIDNPGWALVYWDNQSVVYLRRLPKYAALIDALEYRVARPRFLDFSYLDRYQQGGFATLVLPALDRERALNPDNQFVALARIYLLYGLGQGYSAELRKELERIQTIPPDYAMKHSALAVVLSAAGEKERARDEAILALRMDATDPAGLAVAPTLGIDVRSVAGSGAH